MKPLDLDAIRERLTIYSEPIPDPHEIVDRIGRDPRANSEARGIAGLLVGLERVYRQDVPDLLALVDLQTRAPLAVDGERKRDERDGIAVMWSGADELVDAALTAAGLDSREKRDAAREAMRGGR